MVVDDAYADLRMMESILRTAGHDVVSYTDGERLEDRLATELPDVLLLDVVMPGRNGYDILRGLRKDQRTRHTPVVLVTWYDAAAYCNWLSKQEGIAKEQWCYEPNEKGKYAEGMKVKANGLSLSGYRLPTEAEWEYACRAGSVTAWSMGEAEDLLDKYGWYFVNSPRRLQPGGMLRPNGLGFFDLHGNVWEWCQNRLAPFVDTKDPQKEDIVDNSSSREMRGGDFITDAFFLRSASRFGAGPASGVGAVFRPARTVR